jgi:hypothetical protein
MEKKADTLFFFKPRVRCLSETAVVCGNIYDNLFSLFISSFYLFLFVFTHTTSIS